MNRTVSLAAASLDSSAIGPSARPAWRRRLTLSLGLAAMLCGPSAPALRAFSLEGYITITFADWSPIGDHWAWPEDTITYHFLPGYSTTFSDPVLKDQVRLAFRRWSTVTDRSRGTIASFARSNGLRNFEDLQSVVVHEVGHILGLHHPDQGAPLGLNFVPAGGTYVSAPAPAGAVMNSSILIGSYNRTLSFDELDGYEFIYGFRALHFVEVPADTYADIDIFTFADPSPNVLARGGPDTLALPSFLRTEPIPAQFGRLKFNTSSSFPMGIQSLGMNWRIKSATGKRTRSVTIQTSGTDSPSPMASFRNSSSPAHQFDAFETSTLPGIATENEFHKWSSPHSGPIPADESFSIGLELDVWDWSVASVRVEDETGGLTGSFALLSTSAWNRTNTSFAASPAPAPAAAPDGVTYAKGFFITATGLKLQPSASCLVHGVELADVTGLNLRLENLNAATFSDLAAQQRVEPVAGFGQRNLEAQEPFLLVFQGGPNDLPPEVLQRGNYLILDRPDLEDKDLLVRAQSDTGDGSAELYALISRTVIGSAPALCQVTTEVEANDSFAVATPLGLARLAMVAGTISGPQDVDYFSLEAPYRAQVWLTVDTGGPSYAGGNSRDSVATVYGIRGTDLLETDDDDGSGNGGDGTTETGQASSVAGATTRNSGTHYVSVRAYSPQETIVPYRLFLTVTTETNHLGAEIEPNDTPGLADLIVRPGFPIGVRTGAIGQPGDADDYAVLGLSAGSYLHVSVDGDPERDGLGTDVVVQLLSGDGTVLYTADSSGRGAVDNPPAEGFAFLIPGNTTVNSPYIVRVSGSSPNAIGPYSVMVAECRVGPQTLRLDRQQDQILIQWPLHAAGSRLQSSSQPNGPWSDVPENPVVVGHEYALPLPIVAGSRFFRLAGP